MRISAEATGVVDRYGPSSSSAPTDVRQRRHASVRSGGEQATVTVYSVMRPVQAGNGGVGAMLGPSRRQSNGMALRLCNQTTTSNRYGARRQQ
jgi:hypothetical protein